jgi:hypothetical protein
VVVENILVGLVKGGNHIKDALGQFRNESPHDCPFKFKDIPQLSLYTKVIYKNV